MHDWFVSEDIHGCPPAPARERTDRYFVDAWQSELGIKNRGGTSGIEIKGLVAAPVAEMCRAPFVGPVDLWTKWAASGIELDADRVIDVAKRRWQRAFDATTRTPVDVSELIPAWFRGTIAPPAQGCNVEITRVAVDGQGVWWTFGFEAYGRLDSVVADLDAVAEIMAGRDAPPLHAAMCQSYPAWLRDVAQSV